MFGDAIDYSAGKNNPTTNLRSNRGLRQPAATQAMHAISCAILQANLAEGLNKSSDFDTISGASRCAPRPRFEAKEENLPC
jgi:hypothetical protein